jgi:VanZ family protein
MRRLRYWVWPLAWAALIWTFSTQAFSYEATRQWILPILHWLLPGARPETLELLHALIRKCGHGVEYLIFSMLLFRGIRGDRTGWRLRWALAALTIAACYAALDEVHQAFVPGRTPAFADVLLDSFGAAAGQLVTWWWAGRAHHAATTRIT